MKKISRHESHIAYIKKSIFNNGPLSRIELGQLTELPLSALTSITRDLLQQKIIIEKESTSPEGKGRGRRRIQLDINYEKLGVIGIKFDANYIRVYLLNLKGKRLYEKEILNWYESNKDLTKVFLRKLKKLVLDVYQYGQKHTDQVLYNLVASPGVVHQHEGVTARLVTVPELKEIRWYELLEEWTQLPSYLERVEMFQALGEYAYGGSKGSNMLYITLSNGIGAAILDQGKGFLGSDGSAGELGHMNVVENGNVCKCGMKGCLEAYLHPEIWMENRDFEWWFEQVQQGKKKYEKSFSEGIKKFSKILGNSIQILNPDQVVLGGLFSKMFTLMKPQLNHNAKIYVLPEIYQSVSIRAAKLGPESCDFGMIEKFSQNYFK